MPTNKQISFPIPVSAIAIDLDGTLLDTASDLAEGVNRMLHALGRPRVELAVLKSYIGDGMSRLIKRALTQNMETEPTADLFARALPLFEKSYMEVLTRQSNPYPGVLDALRSLKDLGYRLACLTNKSEQFTHPLLRGKGLAQFFELVICGDTLPHKKPHPYPLHHIAQTLNTPLAQILVIGDSKNDILCAQAAGCKVFCVPYGYAGPETLQAYNPDAFIANLADIADLITPPSQ